MDRLSTAKALSPLFLAAISIGCGGGSLSTSPPPPPIAKTIAQIQVTSQPVIVFDHIKDQQEPLNIPDSQITAWREANGTVNLMIPHFEAYRMRGPDLEHLTIDPNKIYSSTQSASQIPEDLYNYHHWLMGRTVWMASIFTRWRTASGMPAC